MPIYPSCDQAQKWCWVPHTLMPSNMTGFENDMAANMACTTPIELGLGNDMGPTCPHTSHLTELRNGIWSNTSIHPFMTMCGNDMGTNIPVYSLYAWAQK